MSWIINKVINTSVFSYPAIANETVILSKNELTNVSLCESETEQSEYCKLIDSTDDEQLEHVVEKNTGRVTRRLCLQNAQGRKL